MNTPNSNVARIVRTLLTYQDRTRSELALSLGVHVSAVNKALNGRRSWDVNDLAAMAEFFNVSPALFFEDSERLISATHTRRDPQEGEISKDITGREITAHFLDDTLFQVAA